MRFMDRAEYLGVWNGDAWRDFDCGWWTGEDGRGISVVQYDPVTGKKVLEVPTLSKRLTRVEQWRLGQVHARTGKEAVWGGSGPQLEVQMPASRLWMRGNATKHNQWMRDQGVWLASAPHGMVAMQHAHVVGRKIGVDVLEKPERIWWSGAKNDGKAVSAKVR